MYVFPMFISLCQSATIPLQIFTISFNILYHEIFASELIMIWKMRYDPNI